MQEVSVGVDNIFATYLVAMATSLDKLEKATYPLSVRKVLSYGVKITKIGPVDPEIFDQIRQFFGRIIPDVHK